MHGLAIGTATLGPSRWLLVVIDFGQAPARVVTAFGNRRDLAGWTLI